MTNEAINTSHSPKGTRGSVERNKKKHTLKVQRSGQLVTQQQQIDENTYQGIITQPSRTKMRDTLNLESPSALKPPSALELRNKGKTSQLSGKNSHGDHSTKLLKKKNTETLEGPTHWKHSQSFNEAKD